MEQAEHSHFDYRSCPNCGTTMQLAFVEPRLSHRKDGYERHVYRCESCTNTSRFVFEASSRVAA
jgi:ssDNA-binding Zn-finger/Zn-ribbon topoisomerase 1